MTEPIHTPSPSDRQDDATPSDAGQEQSPPALPPSLPVRYDELWLSSLFRPLLITLLIGCIDVAFIGFLRHLVPSMPAALGTILLVLAAGGALVGGYTTTLLVRPEHRERRRLGYRLAELTLILSVVRLALWIGGSGLPSARAFFYRPVETLIDVPFFVGMMLVGSSWGIAVLITEDFLEMALRPDELIDRSPSYRNRYAYDSRLRSDRRALLRRFTELWALGGVLLLLLTAGSQVTTGGSRLLALTRQNIAPSVIGAGIVYFLVGFLLIAIGRLAVLRAQWQIEGIPGGDGVVRRWPLYALVVVVVIGVIAALLPLGSTFWIGQILFLILTAIYLAVYMAFGVLVSMLAALMPMAEENQRQSNATFEPPTPPEPFNTPELPPWLGGSIFWIALMLLLFYAAFIYFSGRGVHLRWLARFWQTLQARWRIIFGEFVRGRAIARIPDDETEQAAKERGRWRRRLAGLWPHRMSPTERVRYFYLSMLDQAAERGIARRPGETPFRFAPRLEEEIADEIDSIEILTNEFVQIHYGNRTVQEQSLPFLQRLWQRIREALRR